MNIKLNQPKLKHQQNDAYCQLVLTVDLVAEVVGAAPAVGEASANQCQLVLASAALQMLTDFPALWRLLAAARIQLQGQGAWRGVAGYPGHWGLEI